MIGASEGLLELIRLQLVQVQMRIVAAAIGPEYCKRRCLLVVIPMVQMLLKSLLVVTLARARVLLW